MLQNSFYTVLRAESSPGNVKALLSINKEHPILKGHFPGQPVVPGVCMMQIIKELTEQQTKNKLNISRADTIKFLSIIDPRLNPEVEALVSYIEKDGSFSVTASLMAGEVTFFKLKATLDNA